MCKISNSQVHGFQSWYFPDKPYCEKMNQELIACFVKHGIRAPWQ